MNGLGLGIFRFYTNAGRVLVQKKSKTRAPPHTGWILSNPNLQKKNIENSAISVRGGTEAGLRVGRVLAQPY
jgi:hypothetical protein